MNTNNIPLKVFISYKWESKTHKEWVKKFASDLRENGIDAILDDWYVRLGDSFTEYMTSMIDIANVVLFIMTKESVAAVESKKEGAVKFEMQLAVSRKISGEKLRVIGIYREGDKIAVPLRDNRYADFRDDYKYDENLKALVDDLLNRKYVPIVRSISKINTLSDRHLEVIRTLLSLFNDKPFLKEDMDIRIDTHSRFISVFNDLLRAKFILTKIQEDGKEYFYLPLSTIEGIQNLDFQQR